MKVTNKEKFRILILVIIVLVLNNCTEPFEFDVMPVFESSLVIEATLTDENKIQSVILSRSFPLDSVITSKELGARVQIIDDTGRIFNFDDMGNGNYSSNLAFAVEQNRAYTLNITTSDGNSYISEPSSIEGKSNIDEIFAVREFKDDIEEGVFIYLDSFDPTSKSNYYRYEYEETYKIIVPFSSRGLKLFLVPDVPIALSVDTRLSDSIARICYSTDSSRQIIQTSTVDLEEDRVNGFPVRFISRQNPILSHRYSILVKQYVQSKEAFTYYQTLNTFSSSESLFSQVQTGFLEGNIRSQKNTTERVIGFFEVTSVTEKRLFFNYEDLFPGEELPEYFIDCSLLSPSLIQPFGSSPLPSLIANDLVDFFSENDERGNPQNLATFIPYIVTPAGCGDCSRFSSKTVPGFWEE